MFSAFRTTRRDLIGLLLAGSALVALMPHGPAFGGIADEFAATLTSPSHQQFMAWRTSRKVHETKLDSYWAVVEGNSRRNYIASRERKNRRRPTLGKCCEVSELSVIGRAIRTGPCE